MRWGGEQREATGTVTLSRESSTHVGKPFVRWRTTARMTEARAQLWAGRRPSAVARRGGFAHLSAFSRAFSSAHGVPPSEWLRREVRETPAARVSPSDRTLVPSAE